MRRVSVLEMVLFMFLVCSFCLGGRSNVSDVYSSFLQTVTVNLVPATVTVPVYQNFTIDVAISGVTDLYGWEFQLGWNATLLSALNVSEGGFLKTGGTTFFSPNVNATAGNLIVDCSLTGNILGVSGGGTLASVTFSVLGVGQCALNLYGVELADSSDNSISNLATGGYGYFTPPQIHDVAVTQVTVSPTTLLSGGTVSINATVQNEGSFAEVFNVTAYADSEVIDVQPVSLGSNFSTIVMFLWNTTGLGDGDYNVSASASIVPGEINTTNNSMQAASPVTLLYNGHDIAVTRVGFSKTVVGQECNMSITVIVKDYGIFSEAFNTTVYAGSTAIYEQSVSLQSGIFAAIPFVWNTSNLIRGNYTISSYASPVPGETDVSNNNLTGGWIILAGTGDLTGPSGWPDGKVDMRDISYVARQFNTDSTMPGWNPNADVNNDNKVDMKDIAIVAKHFGQQYS